MPRRKKKTISGQMQRRRRTTRGRTPRGRTRTTQWANAKEEEDQRAYAVEE